MSKNIALIHISKIITTDSRHFYHVVTGTWERLFCGTSGHKQECVLLETNTQAIQEIWGQVEVHWLQKKVTGMN